MKISLPYISNLKQGEIFVFGSNEAGIHGAGAANLALSKFGAIYGQGYGLQGQSFGIPTKDKNIKTLPLSSIQVYVNKFLGFASEHQEYNFLVTKVGTGLAGLETELVAPLFQQATKIDNIYLPLDFLNLYSDERFCDSSRN